MYSIAFCILIVVFSACMIYKIKFKKKIKNKNEYVERKERRNVQKHNNNLHHWRKERHLI
jgi:hypothetical protein